MMAAADSLASLGQPAIAILCDQVVNGSGDEQETAAKALGCLQVDPKAVVPVLERALSGHKHVAEAAAMSLARLGTLGVASLVEALRDPGRRAVAAHGLTALTANSDDVVSALCDALQDTSESVRLRVVEALGFMRGRAAEAVPALLTAKAREGGSWLGYYIDCALAWIAPSAAPVVIESLNSDDAAVRRAAARHVPDAIGLRRESVQLLAEAGMNDPAQEVQSAALMALEQIGINAAEALATVMVALEAAEQQIDQPEVRTRSLLAQEKVRAEVARFARTSRIRLQLTSTMPGRNRQPKRLPVEFDKSVLALLRTCLYWGEPNVSERKLCTSGPLQDNRLALGLDGRVSQTSVHNHLQFLATLCGLDSLVELDEKRQVSRFRADVKKKLATIERVFSDYVKDREELAKRRVERSPFDRRP